MLRKITLITIVLACVVSARAQELKFGVHLDPFFSFLTTDYANVAAAGSNFGTGLGVEVAYEFDATGNYSVTCGADFSLNNGGTLLYKYGGNILPNTEFDSRTSFKNNSDAIPASAKGIPLQAYTKINHRVNYIELPIGLKLRTNELGGSYMRAFFHIPIVKIMVPVTAGAKIFAPDVSATGYLDDNSDDRYAVAQADKFVTERKAWKDITPLQIGLGLGAGVEISPNSDGGLSIYAGLYYNHGLIDITSGFAGQTAFSSPENSNAPISETQERNPRNAQHNIGLRLGVIF